MVGVGVGRVERKPARQQRKQAETTELHSRGVCFGRAHTESELQLGDFCLHPVGKPLAGIALALFANQMMEVRYEPEQRGQG